ncbi:MAG: hypothetical protein Q9187_000374 [Circinaria calcarea]
MEAFVSRKKQKPSPSQEPKRDHEKMLELAGPGEDESTELKLATLASLHPLVGPEVLLDHLVSADGSVVDSSRALDCLGVANRSPKKSPLKRIIGYQSSLSAYKLQQSGSPETKSPKSMAKKGQTLHVYSAEDVARYTPCSIIHNFLPAAEAEALLQELLKEAVTFEKQTFKLFDNVVQSPHRSCFYVDSLEEIMRQKTEYLYNGSYLTVQEITANRDVRQITPQMRIASSKVEDAVNAEIAKRINDSYAGGKKLRYQSPNRWRPNAAFVNCYAGGNESVGYHSDQLTYLGPRAVIGSLSLGVAREFRVRRIVARDEHEGIGGNGKRKDAMRADAEGQIAIHLPHNSLLVMHAEMQEEYKHSIHPAAAIDPHPTSGTKRINVTYRHYRQSFHPRFTPRCKCNVPTVLRCVQRKKENRGRYMWTCDAGNTPGKEGCGYFQWAEFDDDGNPPWITEKNRKNETELRALHTP